MAFRIAIIIITTSLISYLHLVSIFEKKTIEELQKYVADRGELESEIFRLSEANHQILKTTILTAVTNIQDQNIQARFNELFEAKDDGSIRLKEIYYTGYTDAYGVFTKGITGYIEKGVEVTLETQQLMVVMYQIIAQYGPAWASWQDHFPDLYLTALGDMLVEYWIGVPWGLDAPADLDLANEVWVYPADQAHNPKRETVWTSIYYDNVSNNWMVTCATPVYFHDRHIMTIGHDILLHKLLSRTLSNNYPGTYNMIFRADGVLIAHPYKYQELKQEDGEFSILTSNDQVLINDYHLVTTIDSTKNMQILSAEDHYLAVARLEGPDWFFVTVYPKKLLTDQALSTAKFILLLGILSLIIEISILSLILRKQITAPLNNFINLTNFVKKGQFTLDEDNATHLTQLIRTDIPLEHQNEIGQLADSFNLMLKQLKASYEALEEYNRTLELRVNERTEALSNTLKDLQATQDELVQSEKMAALGQLIAGVAHEINTPLGAIRSSVDYMAEMMTQLDDLPAFFNELPDENKKAFLNLLQHSQQQTERFSVKEERKIKRKLIRALDDNQIDNAMIIADKLVDMGVYEGVDQWLPALKTDNGQHLISMAYDVSGLFRRTKTIKEATSQAAKVVFALKNYARYDHSGKKVLANIQEGIETVLTLYFHQIKQGTEVIRHYGEIPDIYCYPDELNQVWTNLVHNALQAMRYKGTLTITLSESNQQIVIQFNDTGTGIPPEIQSKIFQPFFTTKPAGEGSGLGLDIVKKIITKHDGEILLDSEPGNTTFTIKLPIIKVVG